MPTYELPYGPVDRDVACDIAGIGGLIQRMGDAFIVGTRSTGIAGGFYYTLRPHSRRGMGTLAATAYLPSGWTVIETGDGVQPMGDPQDCDSCGETFDQMTESYYYCDYCGDRTCANCGPCDEMTNDDDYYDRHYGVHSWDYKPSPYMPKGNYPTEPLMGVELEVGGRTRDISGVVTDIDPEESHLYMKEDGSISGVEIVTHPMTLAWSRTFPFNDLLRGLRNECCHVDDGYGLHVHVSRSAFRRAGKRSAPHQMAWLMFMYRNARELQLLARRQESRWAAFKTPRPGELRLKALSDGYRDDRYIAVNCNNARTYELRFFKSTLDETQFHAAIEFADASVEYTRTIKTADVLQGSALTWSDFETWVQGRFYPHLESELADIRAKGDDRFYE